MGDRNDEESIARELRTTISQLFFDCSCDPVIERIGEWKRFVFFFLWFFYSCLATTHEILLVLRRTPRHPVLLDCGLSLLCCATVKAREDRTSFISSFIPSWFLTRNNNEIVTPIERPRRSL